LDEQGSGYYYDRAFPDLGFQDPRKSAYDNRNRRMRRRGWRPVYAQTRWTRKLLFRKLRKHVAQSRFADCSAVNGDVDGFIAPRPRTGAVDVFDVLVDVFVCADRMGPVYCWPKIGLLTIANSKAWREVFNVRWPMIDKVGLLKLPSHSSKKNTPVVFPSLISCAKSSVY